MKLVRIEEAYLKRIMRARRRLPPELTSQQARVNHLLSRAVERLEKNHGACRQKRLPA